MATSAKKKREIDYSLGVLALFIYSFFIATTKSLDILLNILFLKSLFIIKTYIYFRRKFIYILNEY